jgi:hypothetical protein
MVPWLVFLSLNRSQQRTCLRYSTCSVTFDLPLFTVHQLFSTLVYFNFCYWSTLGFLLCNYIPPWIIQLFVTFAVQLFYLWSLSTFSLLPFSYLPFSYFYLWLFAFQFSPFDYFVLLIDLHKHNPNFECTNRSPFFFCNSLSCSPGLFFCYLRFFRRRLVEGVGRGTGRFCLVKYLSISFFRAEEWRKCDCTYVIQSCSLDNLECKVQTYLIRATTGL